MTDAVPNLEELRAREDEVRREWEWLNETINEIARVHADNEQVSVFRLLHEQAMAVGRRRLELCIEIAETERKVQQNSHLQVAGRDPISSNNF